MSTKTFEIPSTLTGFITWGVTLAATSVVVRVGWETGALVWGKF